ncbi:hypothetical protein ACMU_11530 [Actibacterium mucosum KCTC 23349]|uniref:GGDEF domain-containing protein n=1 Tax=Actibacterium mucosum KCTC 23349 TaxID=1454373 RepID=A0A037ZKH4_9RHOB|nr:GGDEF domain-containing protein [Actibacterium mucosum]KAJ55321.1 hypothetical protein ACMU_11530 [Actibacterium mucosum KCTC 23349]
MTTIQKTLSDAALAQLMPMSMCISGEGMITFAGPTLNKICPGRELVGAHVLEVFEVKRPRGTHALAQLLKQLGGQVHLGFVGQKDKGTLRGVWARTEDGGAVINLSFGIGVVDAVSTYDLNLGDFAPTDLAVEMLYLVEAKSAVTGELNSLTRRLENARNEAEKRAFTDTLTGLHNRRAMDAALARLIDGARDFALVHIDLDFFKQVNDTYGHAAGDHVLVHVAKVLCAEIEEDDLAVRIGGDEFLLILADCVSREALMKIALRVIDGLEVPIDFGDAVCRISASIGIAQSTLYAEPNADRILADTDTATYASKHAGRAQATMFEDLKSQQKQAAV